MLNVNGDIHYPNRIVGVKTVLLQVYEYKIEGYRYRSSAFNNNNVETLNIALSRPSIFRELNTSLFCCSLWFLHNYCLLSFCNNLYLNWQELSDSWWKYYLNYKWLVSFASCLNSSQVDYSWSTFQAVQE